MKQDWKGFYEQREDCEPEDDSVYSSLSLDHFLHPRNVGRVNGYHGLGPACGDSLEMTVRIDENDIITEVGYLVYGCAGAIATTSMVSEMVKGKEIRTALHITAQDVVKALGGLPDRKVHCSLMGLEALKLALADALFGRRLIREGKIRDYDEYRSLRQAGKIRFELRPVEKRGNRE